MKKIYILLILTSFIPGVLAQTFDDQFGVIDHNNIRATIGSSGLHFWPDSAVVGFEYPKNSGKQALFCSSLWIGACNNGTYYTACERYRQQGRDFFPGPVMDQTYYSSQTPYWNRVWKVTQAEIDSFQLNWQNPAYVIPPSIADWPATGNSLMGQAYSLAPFFDNNGDEQYNPHSGDYPIIRGDEAIYFIYNDDAQPHTESDGSSMGVEVHGLAYQYSSDARLRNTLFINYLIYNRSLLTYDSLFLGLFSDIDIGGAYDDYIGCDTALATYFAYNAADTDLIYGSDPPAVSVTLLNAPMTHFSFYNNLGGYWAMTDPENAYQYYSNMNSYWKDTTHMVYGHNGHINFCSPPCVETHFQYPGYPGDTTQWNEISAGSDPYDRRGVAVSGPYTLSPGAYLSLDVAYTVSDSATFARNCTFSNVDYNYYLVQQIRDFFDGNLPDDGSDLVLGVNPGSAQTADAQIEIFPNPVRDIIHIKVPANNGDFKVIVQDATGRTVLENEYGYCEINAETLNPGVYFLTLKFENRIIIRKFVKQ